MPLITITDNFGTNGNEIAKVVAVELDVELFDDRRLQNIVTKTGMPASAKYRFEKHAPGFWGLLHSHEHQYIWIQWKQPFTILRAMVRG